MAYTTLKSIPQLQGLGYQERNARIREAYRRDRRLLFYNLFNFLTCCYSIPLTVKSWEWIMGYPSLWRSLPIGIGFAMVFSMLMNRLVIYPRIRKALAKDA